MIEFSDCFFYKSDPDQDHDKAKTRLGIKNFQSRDFRDGFLQNPGIPEFFGTGLAWNFILGFFGIRFLRIPGTGFWKNPGIPGSRRSLAKTKTKGKLCKSPSNSRMSLQSGLVANERMIGPTNNCAIVEQVWLLTSEKTNFCKIDQWLNHTNPAILCWTAVTPVDKEYQPKLYWTCGGG